MISSVLGLDYTVPDVYSNPEEVTKKMEEVFKTKTRDEWTVLFLGKDACTTPVLDLKEAEEFPMNKQRQAFSSHDGRVLPEAAPRFYSAEEFKKLRSKL